ncbi:beta-ketoacyl synthase [Geothermobacter hydrogeniphilus]|uniref:3-oxoacyl-[acyl-carrier-protein] synthase 1 n=1 Tax=Geothermobacter hydrogeniphilus TaxID=1969733 RepID=A0A2K2HBQ5_9BACT|nr:beta-ketoacyl-[acyl-carrier-protein] synthase family protein [Geothermobacter hydrogeniphilus]PNU20691.1 beta-ketoacyl synthase [Geothermobacter hydrogeniphilus]
MQRVAITGIGIVSCLGSDLSTVEKALQEGRSGIVVDPRRIELGFRSPLTGTISDCDLSLLSRKQRKSMPDFAQWAYVAATDALKMAGLSAEEIRNPRCGLIFGCDSSCLAAVEQVDQLRRAEETHGIGSGLIFRSMTSTITMNLNTLLQTQGACWSLSSACSSGGHAVGQAAELIAGGRQDVVICGGAQEINPESMCSFDALGAFSARITDPEAACRPFDRGRDGLVPSGGAAGIVLENFDRARRRGAPILGEVLGYGFSSDGEALSVPSRTGLSRAMQMALAQAGISAPQVDYVCAHATSTPAGDFAEAVNLHRVFSDDGPWVSSLKGMVGHELWMAGAAQIVYASLMARSGFIAPNRNYAEPDPEMPPLRIARTAIDRGPRTVLCNSAGFGGTNAALVVRFRV